MFKKNLSPQEVVQKKQAAESSIFNIRDRIKIVKQGLASTICEEEMEQFSSELELSTEELEHETSVLNKPVNLSETSLKGSIVKLKLVESLKDEYKHLFDEKDLKWNSFAYIGEFSHAPHHVMVCGMTTGRMYCMVHSDLFEIDIE